jgi:hypothetical protein
VLAVGACFVVAKPAHAQGTFGVRAGASSLPDQFFIGAHVESPELTQTGPLTFRPNVELGFGHGTTLLAGNLEFVFWVHFPDSTWSSYFGAGPSIDWVHNDFESRAHGGFNGLVGFQNSSGLFLEVKRGDGGNPELKVAVGYVLKKSKTQ